MQKFNSKPIDIIVPWVNPNDKTWQNDFSYWKEKETGNKDACRYNDWGFLKYVFRSIEKKCPWCRYVFLVLSKKTQIPEWLNTDYSRVKIVYHEDYIPAEFLPTFNSNVIELFYGNIKELSENFILINDDMIFTGYTDESFYFMKDLPVYKKGIRTVYNSDWDKTLLKSAKRISDETEVSCPVYDTYHLPVAYKKSIFSFLLHKFKTDIYESLNNSRFRHNYNYMHFMMYFALNTMQQCYYTNESRGKYYSIKSQQSFNLNYPSCCLNENENSTDEGCKAAIKALNTLFPNKSAFEKTETTKACQPKTVVTMTSYPKRINAVKDFIINFLKTQIVKPDYFYLWLSSENFPNKEKDLPCDLINACKDYNVNISWVDYDDGCTKRWCVYPKHYNDIVVAVDEDNIYDIHLIERMRSYNYEKKCIYAVWDKLTNYLVPTSGIEFRYKHYKYLKLPNKSIRMKIAGQSVYPPKTFPLDALNKDYLPLRLKYCKRCDESWLQPFLRCSGIESSTLGLSKLSPDDLMERTGINANGKRINGVWWKNLQMYIVLRLFPEMMKKWKTIFPEYDTKEWDKYTVDELVKMLE